jgi:hypothetical protein
MRNRHDEKEQRARAEYARVNQKASNPSEDQNPNLVENTEAKRKELRKIREQKVSELIELARTTDFRKDIDFQKKRIRDIFREVSIWEALLIHEELVNYTDNLKWSGSNEILSLLNQNISWFCSHWRVYYSKPGTIELEAIDDPSFEKKRIEYNALYK